MLPRTSMQRCGDRGRVYGHGEDGAAGRGRGLVSRNPVGEPDAGNPPVRFDEREVETEQGVRF
jgi:hypothetical protein